ncbi:hypothetical protein CWO89_34790 [Bradyrhizobium sp. Leo170]|nr:hypothetical protein CWO89_34790 [Bradyrhizobium sp. Leo170]
MAYRLRSNGFHDREAARFRPGPRLGLPSVWRADVGINGYQFDWLARIEGLERLKQPDDGFTHDFIAETLIARGPIWAALRLPSISGNETLRDGHIIVLTGLIEDMLCYNDPSYPARGAIYFYNLSSTTFSSRIAIGCMFRGIVSTDFRGS